MESPKQARFDRARCIAPIEQLRGDLIGLDIPLSRLFNAGRSVVPPEYPRRRSGRAASASLHAAG